MMRDGRSTVTRSTEGASFDVTSGCTLSSAIQDKLDRFLTSAIRRDGRLRLDYRSPCVSSRFDEKLIRGDDDGQREFFLFMFFFFLMLFSNIMQGDVITFLFLRFEFIYLFRFDLF